MHWTVFRLATIAIVSNFQVESSECSRPLSRRIREVLEKDIFKVLPFDAMELPDSCQLNPKFDVYLDQERHKSRSSDGNYRCRYCGKTFKNEYYIDNHMNLKHPDLIQANRTTCLADLCPIFGCGVEDGKYSKNGSRKKKRKWDESPQGFAGIVPCTEAEIEKVKYKCEVLSRRCFGPSSAASGEINEVGDYFSSHICRNLHCENGIMKGVIVDRGEDDGMPTILATVLRWMFSIGIVMAVVLYAFGSGLVTSLFSKSAADRKRGNRSSQGLFLSSFWRRIFARKVE